MLIINADDWGGAENITNSIFNCIKLQTVTSVSAMVFMTGSESAAQLSLDNTIDTGLHLNLSLPFDSHKTPIRLKECHNRVVRFLRSKKYNQLIYNPFISNDFEYCFRTQWDEFTKIYARSPARVDGHHHLHLCANMIIGDFIPHKIRVRRNFTFLRKDKNVFNRSYRSIIDVILLRRYVCTDYFFCIQQYIKRQNSEKEQFLNKILDLQKKSTVELTVHPDYKSDYNCLNSDRFLSFLRQTKLRSFQSVNCFSDEILF